VTFMSVLFCLSREEYVWRKVCQPIRFKIPTFNAAGRMKVRMMHWPQ
jgi:hypothetical protein